MRVKTTGLMMLGLLASCAPPYIRQTGPVPADALSCARASLERMGFAFEGGSGEAFKSRRTVNREWIYRVEHVMRVSRSTRGTPVLKLNAERVEVRDLSKAPMQHVAGKTDYEPPVSARRLDPDQALKNEVEQVILDCGGSVQGGTGLAR